VWVIPRLRISAEQFWMWQVMSVSAYRAVSSSTSVYRKRENLPSSQKLLYQT